MPEPPLRQPQEAPLVGAVEQHLGDRETDQLTIGDPWPAAPPAPSAFDNAALLERVRSLRSRWNQSSPTVRHGADPLSGRFMAALERLIAAYPQAFAGTELDSEANRRKMEKLCEKVEGFLAQSAPAPDSSQALAALLREALASNTIGGRAGEEARWRAMAEDVRAAQASWSRLGPAPGEVGRQLGERFHRAGGVPAQARRSFRPGRPPSSPRPTARPKPPSSPSISWPAAKPRRRPSPSPATQPRANFRSASPASADPPLPAAPDLEAGGGQGRSGAIAETETATVNPSGHAIAPSRRVPGSRATGARRARARESVTTWQAARRRSH